MSISITVPLKYNALVRASDMFHQLAMDCEDAPTIKEELPVEVTTPVINNDDAKQIAVGIIKRECRCT